MDDMALARINGGVITWALKRSGATLDSLATAKVTTVRLAAWEKGEEFPSEGQAEALAIKLGIAYAMFFMPIVPPDEPLDLPDLRTIDGRRLTRPSANFLEVLDDTIARREWYRSELPNTSNSLDFVRKFTLNDKPAAVAKDMHAVLSLDPATRRECKNYEEFLKTLVARAERAGVLVMRSALVRHITSRP